MIGSSSQQPTEPRGSCSGGGPPASSGSDGAGDDAEGRCKSCLYSEPANDANRLRCVHDKFVLVSRAGNPPSDGVVVEVDEGWGFRVGPDFGCRHYVKLRVTGG